MHAHEGLAQLVVQDLTDEPVFAVAKPDQLVKYALEDLVRSTIDEKIALHGDEGGQHSRLPAGTATNLFGIRRHLARACGGQGQRRPRIYGRTLG